MGRAHCVVILCWTFAMAGDCQAASEFPRAAKPFPAGDAARQELVTSDRAERLTPRRIILAQNPNQPNSNGPMGGEKGKDQKSDEEKKPSVPVITRPDKPETPGDPAQLEIVPDAEGKVRFNFAGQKWQDVLEWLARVSNLSLDWQELPGDFLNLRTQRDYTLAEAQDLINRHLLARGFTMIKSGEILTVTSIAKLNPAFVPRVEPEELNQRMDYEFVKVSFPLKWILAEGIVEEIRPMLSSNGKISALKEVNRFEAMDAALNLKEIYRMLQSEQSQESSKGTLVREFKLEHRRATDVLASLESILGLDKNRPRTTGGRGGGGDMMSMQMMQQMQQQMQQMQQQMQQQGNQQKGGRSAGPNQEPRLVINERENSILAHAPPDKMEIIEQTIKAIDVPGTTDTQLLQNLNRVKSYRLSTLDPQPLVMILREVGDLTPQSRLQVDEKSRAIILYGAISDHLTVQSLIQRLDGSNRSFEVIPLRKVQADSVAGTIQYMFGAENKDKNQNNRSMFFGYYGGPSRTEEEEDKRPFKVDADVENNRLLIWANEVEMQEIRQLLVKMGEVLPGMSNPETVRTIELDSDEDAELLLERLRQRWPEMEANPLNAPRRTTAPATSPASPRTLQRSPQPALESEHRAEPAVPTVRLASQQRTGMQVPPAHPLTPSLSDAVPVALEDSELPPELTPTSIPESAAPPVETGAKQSGAPPITVRRGPNGKLIFDSADTEALDRLEELVKELTPPSRDYKVFHLKYPNTWAFGIEMNLKDFFKSESKEEQVTNPYWGYSYTQKKVEPNRLSRKRELKIISDEDSRTILVQGATPQQLQTISELIETYDVPSSAAPQAVRRTRIIQLQFSQAEQIADTVKQVYRDLLSANDPSLQNNHQNGQQQQRSSSTERSYSYRSSSSSDDKTKPAGPPLKYKGLLSVGVDEISNSVVLSAGDDLLEEVEQLVQSLDQAAHPKINVQVLQVKNVDAAQIKERFEKTFVPTVKKSETGRRKQQQQQNPQGNPQQNGQPNDN